LKSSPPESARRTAWASVDLHRDGGAGEARYTEFDCSSRPFSSGFLAGRHHGASHREAFAEALAWGAAAVRLPGTKMPGPADIDRSVVHLLSDPVPALITPITEGES